MLCFEVTIRIDDDDDELIYGTCHLACVMNSLETSDTIGMDGCRYWPGVLIRISLKLRLINWIVAQFGAGSALGFVTPKAQVM